MVTRIVEIVFTSIFEHDVKKLKDSSVKKRLEKHIAKVIENPVIGKPLSYALKGEPSIRIPLYRLIYAVTGKKLILLRFEHRKDAYE